MSKPINLPLSFLTAAWCTIIVSKIQPNYDKPLGYFQFGAINKTAGVITLVNFSLRVPVCLCTNTQNFSKLPTNKCTF